jgi:ABC-type bacteriocin/lantibiotic exporter with double-glycine peptidase domain
VLRKSNQLNSIASLIAEYVISNIEDASVSFLYIYVLCLVSLQFL